MRNHRTVIALLALVLACKSDEPAVPEVCAATTGVPAAMPAHAPFSILVFSRTTGYRHASIASGITALQALGTSNDFTVEATEDPAAFTDANLARFGAVVFLSTTGDVLNDAQQAAFERYIQAGHGFVGVHSASDTEYGWPWYHTLLGAAFASHPAIQQASVIVADPGHLSTASLPNPWMRSDEWYNFQAQPAGVTVLVRVDESTYTGGTMGALHPISWQREYDGGRAWYTAMGHSECSYSERAFLDHLLGGIAWAAGIP